MWAAKKKPPIKVRMSPQVKGGGVLAGDGDKANAHNAQQGGKDVEAVGTALGNDPVEKGDNDAIHRR